MLNVPSQTGEPVPAEVPERVAHDDSPPQALLDYMVTEWAPKTGLPDVLPDAGRFAARRRALSKLFPRDVLVVPTGREQIRANDTTYRFRPGSDFYYLTGNLEPDAVLVMTPREGTEHVAVMFVEPNPGKTDATFFTDRAKGELWVGPRLGILESSRRYGIEARSLADLAPELESFGRGGALQTRTLRRLDARVDWALPERQAIDDELATALSEMRLLKDDYEIAQLEEAIAATKRGFEDVLRALPASRTERYVEGVFNLRARIEGNDVGYNTIAASGRHACTLHWTANDGVLRTGDLLLVDAGVEAPTLYTADITRTVPIGGSFSREQREVYALVLAAQQAAFERCVPGADFMAPNAAAMSVLAHGLERLGILRVTAAEALREQNQFYKRYSLHNVSHMLGLDVHDCAKARKETYKYGSLQTGMVLTVEPGLYFQPDDLTVPEAYRGIGVRIEDDVVITPSGCRILSDSLPREVEAVERWVSECARAGPNLFEAP
jgi:Xaa-Pro aminopeptidase